MKMIAELRRAMGAILAVAAMIPAAWAHVGLETPQAAVGRGYKAVFTVPHGCDGSPTVEVRIDIPEGVIGVKPMPKPGWTIALGKGAYAKSYAFYHGKQMNEGVQNVTWSGGSLSDEYFDQFVLNTFIAGELEPGARLAFPVTQKCASGELKWSEIAAAGQDAHALEHPAPQLTLIAAGGGHDHAAGGAKGIAITDAWSRPVSGATVGVGYLKLSNTGSEPDVLLGGSSDLAERVEVHETTVGEDGVTRMNKLDEVAIAPGTSIELKPAGMHLMLIGLKGPLKEGDTVKAKLNFKKAGPVNVEFTVRAGGAAPAHQH